MIKRVMTLSLALVLLLTAAAFPANAAEKSAFRELAEFIQKNGEPYHIPYGGTVYQYSVDYTLRENGNTPVTVGLRLEYDPDDDGISFYSSTNDNMAGYGFNMWMHSDGTLEYIYVGTYSGEAHYDSASIYAITNTSVLEPSVYMADYYSQSFKEQMNKMASTLLKTDLEILQVILKPTGKTVADLGFKSYVPGHRHSWDNGKFNSEPTCGNFGEKEYSCAACNSIYLEFFQPTGKHTWDKGKVTQQPTCAAAGVRVYTCTVCEETKEESIPATGKHTWNQGEVITAATCTEAGTLRRTCPVCKATKDETIPALGHAWTLTDVISEGETLHDGAGHYLCTRCGETKEGSLCAGEIFIDMPKKSHWAHDAIDWAFYNSLTGGTSPNTISPNKVVTRGEVVTFLHTLKGKPETEAENPFTDVKKKDFYYDAVLWAAGNGITKGTSETTFSPKNTCSRSEIVMFLWAAAGRPEPEDQENKFQDVKAKDYFYNAVLWAVENGVTGGVDETHFGPKTSCTRAQVMLFLKAAAPILTAEPIR